MRRFLCPLLLILVSAAFVRAGQGELHLRRAQLRLKAAKGDRPVAHHVTLRAEFLPGDLTAAVNPEVHDISVRVGGFTVFELPPAGQRYGLVDRGYEHWRYREPTAHKRKGDRFDLDLALGKLKLAVKDADLTSLLAAGPRDVPVALELNGQVLDSTVTFSTSGRRWRAKNPPMVVPSDGRGTVPDNGGPGGSAGSGPVTPVVLDAGPNSARTSPYLAAAYNEAQMRAVWGSHRPGTSPPFVDFDKETVVAVFLGTRATGGFTVVIEKATRDGDDLVVNWLEGRPGATCVVTQALTSPYVIVRVPKVTGTVRFESRVTTYECGLPGR